MIVRTIQMSLTEQNNVLSKYRRLQHMPAGLVGQIMCDAEPLLVCWSSSAPLQPGGYTLHVPVHFSSHQRLKGFVCLLTRFIEKLQLVQLNCQCLKTFISEGNVLILSFYLQNCKQAVKNTIESLFRSIQFRFVLIRRYSQTYNAVLLNIKVCCDSQCPSSGFVQVEK